MNVTNMSTECGTVFPCAPAPISASAAAPRPYAVVTGAEPFYEVAYLPR